mgnify:CR=1 FL=1
MKLGIRRNTKAPTPSTSPLLTENPRTPEEQSKLNAVMIGRLAALLDDLAEGPRKARDQCVT